MGKLTLHAPDLLIEAAKREAEVRKTSVSKLVSDYFRVFATAGTAGSGEGLPPVTASLVGCLKGPMKTERPTSITSNGSTRDRAGRHERGSRCDAGA